jgi:hypothetical protein
MSTTQKPIEDAIIALTEKYRWLYGEPFFHWASCELEHAFAEDLAGELSPQGYEVYAVDEYTVSWEPQDDHHIGSPDTREEQSDAPPSDVWVTYHGHREVPESEQTWEIHLRPKQSPES